MRLFLVAALITNLHALEKMRPHVELNFFDEAVMVSLDFRQIQDQQWSDLLTHPDRIHETGYGLAGRSGEAALPIFTELLPISSVNAPDVNILSYSSHSIRISSLKQTPMGQRETDPPQINRNYDWASIDLASEMKVQVGEPVHIMGKAFLPLSISPLGVDYSQQEVNVPEKLVIQITGVVPRLENQTEESASIRSIIPNNEIYSQLGHYLIITPPLFEPYLTYLVDWKLRKGHPVTVTSTNMAGQTPTAIKAYIQDAYDTWNDPPKYVLLIGDEDRGIGGFYVYNPDNEALVTDHPYALLEGEDSFPEAWVGRLSVDTIGELVVVMSKILSYESQPFLDDPGWFKRALMVGTVTAAISTQHVNNWVGRKLMENGFTQVDTAYYPMQSSLSRISTPINNGVGFVNYRGLGAWDHWIGPYFYNSDIENLYNGHKLPILTSIVCGGGNYAAPVDPVFGEKWLRAGTSSVPKGAVAFIGPSELHTHTQFNNVIDIALYSGLFDLGMNELGPALGHAKLELWRNYHQSEFLPFGQSAEFYQNVYNILGDPGMAIWTDTPQMLVVDLPDSLNQDDDHIVIMVEDEAGVPIPNAFVFVSNSENGSGLQTDPSGVVLLPFISGESSELLVTITGKNLNPVLTSIPIGSSVNSLIYEGWDIAPDGIIQAGGMHNLEMTLVNQSITLENLTLSLHTSSEAVNLIDSVYIIPSFHSDHSLTLNDLFSFEVDANSRHGEVIDFNIEVDTGSEVLTWCKQFPIQAPDLYIIDVMIEAGELVAGDSLSIRLIVENRGGIASLPVMLELLNHNLVSTSIGIQELPLIDWDLSAETEGAFSILLSDQIFPGEVIPLIFVGEAGGRMDTLRTEIIVEEINRFSPSGPDNYGYRVFDNRDVSYSMAPDYEWTEIDPNYGGAGTRLAIQDDYEEEDETAYLDLPFSVSYYGQSYEEITICSNGWLAMGHSPEVSFYNRVIPSASGPTAMIAPFWDDLITQPGGVSYYIGDDQLIIEWAMMSNMEVGSSLNFQVIIYSIDSHPTTSGDNLIKFQYKDYFNYDTFANFSTSGIESPDYSTGIQASFNNDTDRSIGEISSGQSLLFTTERGQRFEAPEISLSQSVLSFVQNPWSTASDSIEIVNTGGSDLVYDIGSPEEVDPTPAVNPVSGFNFIKGGAEPDGEPYASSLRDIFDYEWLDQDDPNGPQFEWRDISQTENELIFPGDPDDSSIGPFDIGFDFPFFADIYTEFMLSSNGSISFTSAEYPWNNLPLPNGSAPPAFIAAWWDDLNNNSGVQGIPYLWSNGQDTTVITWDNFPKFGTEDRHTFQLILMADGNMILQYLEMEGIGTSSTVGIQNVLKNKGLQICYNSPNSINDGTAILIHRQSSWLIVNKWTDVIAPGESSIFRVDTDTRGLNQGSFSVPLVLTSNARNLAEIPINIHLEVIHGTPPYGDVNADYLINIQDLTALIDFVLYLEIPTVVQAESADLNSDDELNVLDATLLLEHLHDQ
ncbi:MAG: hypothetical protein HQ556_16250 [Candidatus Marinimicrobia bacterium]|nr:hypothetical protein [Candidatus Neomarinimicrobiota bacterium]